MNAVVKIDNVTIGVFRNCDPINQFEWITDLGIQKLIMVLEIWSESIWINSNSSICCDIIDHAWVSFSWFYLIKKILLNQVISNVFLHRILNIYKTIRFFQQGCFQIFTKFQLLRFWFLCQLYILFKKITTKEFTLLVLNIMSDMFKIFYLF